MSYWMFVVTQHNIDDQHCDPYSILKQRHNDEFWGLDEHVRNRRHLEKGDDVVFYVGSPYMFFAAKATLATGFLPLDEHQQKKLGHNNPCHRSKFGVFLENTQLWDRPRLVRDLMPQLEFIRNEDNWGPYFMGSVRKLSDDDFRVIEGKQS